MLGPESASQILKQFQPREIEAVSREMARFNLITQEQQEEILREFSEVAVAASTSISAGVEFTRNALERALLLSSSPVLRRSDLRLGTDGGRPRQNGTGTLKDVEGVFRRLGLVHIRREPFAVTTPDPEAMGVVSGGYWTARVRPLWPNLVRTSTCDVRGPLIYGRRGTLSELSGKAVAGAIVVLEFGGKLLVDFPDIKATVAQYIDTGVA